MKYLKMITFFTSIFNYNNISVSLIWQGGDWLHGIMNLFQSLSKDYTSSMVFSDLLGALWFKCFGGL